MSGSAGMGVSLILSGVGAGRDGGRGALGAVGGFGSQRTGVGTARSDIMAVSAILMGAGAGRVGAGRS